MQLSLPPGAASYVLQPERNRFNMILWLIIRALFTRRHQTLESRIAPYSMRKRP